MDMIVTNSMIQFETIEKGDALSKPQFELIFRMSRRGAHLVVTIIVGKK